MISQDWLKIGVIGTIGLLTTFSSSNAQRRGEEAQVFTGSPPGLIQKVTPEYPPGFVLHGAKGKGRFRLMLNPRSGLVDEVKIVQSVGYRELNEWAVKALLQWQFKPGTPSPVEVPVEFYIHGGQRILH